MGRNIIVVKRKLQVLLVVKSFIVVVIVVVSHFVGHCCKIMLEFFFNTMHPRALVDDVKLELIDLILLKCA